MQKMLFLVLFFTLIMIASGQEVHKHMMKGGGNVGHTMGGNHGGNAHLIHKGIVLQPLSNLTMIGLDAGCKHTKLYETTGHVRFPMCLGTTDQDMKNGMTIINLIQSRGYLPTCRIMQVMLWMSASVSEGGKQIRDSFVDIGSNIGSCAVHMASLGFPVILAEPVQEHINTIRGSAAINPYFNMDIQHVGISSETKKIRANFGHGARNWGATEFHEVTDPKEKAELNELELKTLDQVIGNRKVSLLKVDCEGCEWAAIKSARRTLKRIPMIKIELVQPDYTAGNETVSAEHVMQYMIDNGFDLFTDHWNEQNLYFGKQPNDILDIDKMFGSIKFKLNTDINTLTQAAITILENPIELSSFNRKAWMNKATDVIAIERTLASKMRKHYLGKD
jgi:FkbM family methyltransferase